MEGQALAVEVVVVVLVLGQLAPIFLDGCVESSNFARKAKTLQIINAVAWCCLMSLTRDFFL